MYLALTTTLSLDAAYDLAEIDEVSRSWRDAAQANIDRGVEIKRRKAGKR